MDDISALLNSDIAAKPKEEVVNLLNYENIAFKVCSCHDGMDLERERERERERECIYIHSLS